MSNPEYNPTSVSTPGISARRQRPWLIALLIGLALLIILLVLLVPAAFVINRLRTSPQAAPQPTRNSVVIAAFKADFQPGQPKPGWHYYWNGTGSMGDTNAYEELRW